MKTDNEIIAEFMEGFRLKVPRNMWHIKSRNQTIDSERMEYDTSWDWLMPVVEKIEIECSEGNDTPQHWSAIFNGQVNTDIRVAYEVVVEFIKWYNSQLATQKETTNS